MACLLTLAHVSLMPNRLIHRHNMALANKRFDTFLVPFDVWEKSNISGSTITSELSNQQLMHISETLQFRHADYCSPTLTNYVSASISLRALCKATF